MEESDEKAAYCCQASKNRSDELGLVGHGCAPRFGNSSEQALPTRLDLDLYEAHHWVSLLFTVHEARLRPAERSWFVKYMARQSRLPQRMTKETHQLLKFRPMHTETWLIQ